MLLCIDNKKISNPTEQDIANGFNSIGGKDACSAGISIVQLFRDENTQLMISGHPKDGWLMPSYEENGREFICFNIDDKQPLSQQEAIELFQACLRGDDSWKSKFIWEEQPVVNHKNTTRNLFVLIAIVLSLLCLRACLN